MKSHHRQIRCNRRHAGFTLIEVLVAILVLSFGLLGMVGMQATSLQVNRDARLQSTAIVLARELAEMMRGNKDIALQANNPYLVAGLSHPLAPPTAAYCLSVGQTCTSTTAVAQAELTDWLARVDDALPGAKISICRDATPYDPTGLPVWSCASASTAPIVIKIGWSRASTKSGSASIDQAGIPSVVLQMTAGSIL
jgi:type IV pilus assembly protein PilV